MLVGLSLVSRLRAWAREFIPSLDEGDVARAAVRIAGHQPHAVRRDVSARSRSGFCKLPEVKEVFTRIGTAEVATDPMPPNIGDCYVMLKPRAQWPDPSQVESRSRRRHCRGGCAKCRATTTKFTQPIQMRFNELISGVRSDVGVKIFGDDMEVLARAPARPSRESAAHASPETTRVKVEQVTGLPMLTVKFKRDGHGPLRADRGRGAGGDRGGHRRQGNGRICSKAIAAFRSSCGCRRICAQTSMRCGACPIALADERKRTEERAERVAAISPPLSR